MPDIVLEPLENFIFNSGLELLKIPSRAKVEVSVHTIFLNVFPSIPTLNLIEWNADVTGNQLVLNFDNPSDKLPYSVYGPWLRFTNCNGCTSV